MAKSMSSVEFRALAEFRYQIRQFLNGSEQAARTAGLEPQQYLFLLALRGLPADREATIRDLAERMQLRTAAPALVRALTAVIRSTRGKMSSGAGKSERQSSPK
jgi:DNA-binding MarR family transcriptional regulator